MKSKPWKLILALALLVAAGGVYWRFCRQRSALPDEVAYACVATGKVFWISRAHTPPFLPAPNPNTGQRTLVPVVAHTPGRFMMTEHYAALLEDPELAPLNKYIDPETLALRKEPR